MGSSSLKLRLLDDADAIVAARDLAAPRARVDEAVGRALPEVPAVACFDTAFHARLPARAATYALPADWRERFGLRRFGFHGLSHAYASRRTQELLGRADLRLVSCHLG